MHAPGLVPAYSDTTCDVLQAVKIQTAYRARQARRKVQQQRDKKLSEKLQRRRKQDEEDKTLEARLRARKDTAVSA